MKIPRILIAYTLEDLERANEIKALLQDEGCQCNLFSSNSIDLGLSDFKDLKLHDALILVWSANALKEPIITLVISHALISNLRIIAISLDTTPLNPVISHIKPIVLEHSVVDVNQLKKDIGLDISEERNQSDKNKIDCINRYNQKLQDENGLLQILGSGEEHPIENMYLPLYIRHQNGVLSEPMNAENLISMRMKYMIVLGNPGSGKTTLLKYISFKSFNKGVGFLPVTIRIHDLMKSDLEIFDYVITTITRYVGRSCSDVIRKDENFCGNTTILLMDGLDEISQSDIHEFCRRLDNFIREYSNCKLIISSRFNGYDKKSFPKFSDFIIEQLREIDIESYIWKVCSRDVREQVLNIVKSDTRLLELAKIPFLLAMICALPDPIGNRATQRAGLYRQCTKYLLRNEDWQEGRPSETDEVANILENALKVVAVRFFKLDRKDAFEEEEILFSLRKLAGNTLNLSPSEILKKICDNSGLLQRAGSTLHFVHRSIWEYYVAVGMQEETYESLFERANAPSWEEPIRLFVGLSPERSLDDILSGIWKRNKGLALRCMMELPSFPHKILDRLVSQLDKQERLGVINKIREDINELRSVLDAKKLLIDTLTALLRIEKDCEVLYHSFDTLQEFSEKHKGLPECDELIINTLDLRNADKRRKKYMEDPNFKFDFVCIPDGKFIMGNNDISRTKDEKPEHPVKLSSFCISKYQVTNKLFYDEFPFVLNRRDARSNKDSEPAIFVTWYEAAIFSKWIGCDLPTEAEWEYAARGGGKDDTQLQDFKKIPDYAWYIENSNNSTHEVGTKKPNSFGLFDMLGNVREWCQDWFSETYYADCLNLGEVENPTGPEIGTHKAIRGGCFDWNVANLTPTYRNYNPPSNSYFVNGFRLVFRDKIVNKTSQL